MKRSLSAAFVALFCLGLIPTSWATILDVKVTEIMYNAPVEGVNAGNLLEFIELKNTGTTAESMAGVSFISGITYSFPADFTLGAGEFVVLVADSDVFHVRYPAVGVDDEYLGTLANSGERLVMVTGVDTLINIKYNDNVPWPILADGHGYSLVPVDVNPTGNQNDAEDWRHSTNVYGSPGADDPTAPVQPDVYINELLTHTDLPDVDAVEIYNGGSTTVDISYWCVTDDRNNITKYQFPANTNIGPGDYITITEADFNPGGTGYRFNRSGDNCYIISANGGGIPTGYAQGWSVDGQYNGVSFGVYTTSINERHFVAQSQVTLGAVNAYPKMGPVVITDISYHPTVVGDEYVVLNNITDTVVELWEPALTDSTWEVSGVRFKFPVNTTMAPNEQVVLTGIDPASFRIKYNLSESDQVFQYGGKLSNAGEAVSVWALLRSDTGGVNNDSVFMPKILVDRVRYNDKAPWPVSADGLGDFLRRNVNAEYGDDVINWTENNGSVLTLSERLSATKVEMFPNPATDVVRMLLPDTDHGLMVIRDISGQLVRRERVNGKTLTINVDDLETGLYIVQLKGEKENYTSKLIIR